MTTKTSTLLNTILRGWGLPEASLCCTVEAGCISRGCGAERNYPGLAGLRWAFSVWTGWTPGIFWNPVQKPKEGGTEGATESSPSTPPPTPLI